MENQLVKVLLIDDEKMDQIAFKRLVEEENLPYDYVVSNSIADGKRVMSSECFDIVIMDYNFEDGNLFDLLNVVDKDIPIVILTGFGNEEMVVQALKNGVSDYLIKNDENTYLKILPTVVNKVIRSKNVEKELMGYRTHLEKLVEERTFKLKERNAQLNFEISERAIVEISLKESEKRFRALVENSPVGIFILQDNQVVYQNPEQKKLLGSLPVLININDFKNIHRDDVKKFRQFLKRKLSGYNQMPDMEMRLHLPEKMISRKEIRWVNCRANTIEYKGGNAILVNMVDITRRKELEQIVMLQEKMVSLGQVAAGIVHEIRNPLSGINVFLDVILEDFEDPEKAKHIKDFIHQAHGAANKIESIIKRVLDFSKPHKPSLRLEDINSLTKKAVQLSDVALRQAEIKVEIELDEDIPKIYVDALLIEQVLLNLIANAYESMRDMSGRRNISVITGGDTGQVFVAVDDSGKGISPDIMEKIFNPFYTTKSDGSGIGLSICQRIITDHRGLIDVSTSKAGGAQFTIRLPIDKRETIR